MAGARNPSRPSFFWQGLLIVLPVIVLVAVGLYSLRQDRLLAQQEAVARAQAIADDLAPLIWNEIFVPETTNSSGAFQVDVAGRLIFPPAYQTVPEPKPFDLNVLTAEQARLWQTLQNADADSRGDEIHRQSCEAFVDSKPPDNFAAAANYRLGLMLAQQERFPEAVARFNRVAAEYPDAAGESGLLWRQLALFKALEIQPGLATLESFCSNIVCQPTPLTAYLLQALQERWPPALLTNRLLIATNKSDQAETREMQDAVQKWWRTWNEHELVRELFAAACDRLPVGRITNRFLSVSVTNQIHLEPAHGFWFDTSTGLKTSISGDGISPSSKLEIEEQHWLAVRAEGVSNSVRYLCLPESEIGIRMRDLLERIKSLPGYFGVSVELAGRTVNEFAPNLRVWHYQHYAGKGGHVDRQYSDTVTTKILALATRAEAGMELLRVNVLLTSPTALFESQRTRALSFGLLITTAALAALVGLLAARRAFNRQLHLSEMKSNFVSSVSHELRAPIASVRLLAESLERGKISEPAKQHEYFRFIGQECRRLSALIENVLDFSRIEQGRKQYEFEPTDLSGLVEQTVKLVQPYAEERGVVLKSEIQNPKFEMELDGRAIQQALVNLIDNAIKHSPKDAAVMITLNSQLSTLNLSVADNGPGIPASEHEKIFERFYRLGSELRRETQGVGIGLSIVKHVVEAHDGRVRVESEVGKGSCFTIELPLKTTETQRHGEEAKE